MPPLAVPVATCLQQCLMKDPRQRLRDIGDARLALESGLDFEPDRERSRAAPGDTRTPLAARRGDRASRFWRSVPSVVVVSGVTLHDPKWSGSRSAPLRAAGIPPGKPAVSPDGRTLAYTVQNRDGTDLLHLRRLDSTESRPL